MNMRGSDRSPIHLSLLVHGPYEVLLVHGTGYHHESDLGQSVHQVDCLLEGMVVRRP